MSIKCCYGCVPPKRHIGCHGTCELYREELTRHTEGKRPMYRDPATSYEVEVSRSNLNKTIMHRKRRGRVN